jgi:hypothetical protein
MNIRKKLRFLKTKYPKIFSFYGPLTTRMVAKKYAKMDKRLDVCAAQVAFLLHETDKGLIKDKVCMEVGCGWLLTHSIIFYLLGAKKIISTDYTKLAEPEIILDAINNSYISSIRDILSPFEDHEILRERLEHIQSIKKWDHEILRKEFNIEYKAPIDLTISKLAPVDFIFSLSVLEHVSSKDLPVLIKNFSEMTNVNGNQFHFIHLEDHYESVEDPFRFLGVADYTKKMEFERGNRVRSSSYYKEFSKYNNTKIVYNWQRKKPLPDKIDASIEFDNDEDLRTSHIGVWVKG